MSKQELAVTRVANACVLLELNGHAILTDPYFTERWFLRRGEPLGLRLTELPPLTAIVATSFAPNHWDLRALREYDGKAATPVYVSTPRMAIWPNNAYVFGSGGTRVFFGGEIADVRLLERYRSRRHPVAVALLPVNGLRPLVGPPLVMGHREAVAGAGLLGARVLVPIHDAHGNDLLSLIVRRHGSAAAAEALATGLDVVCLAPGQRRTLTSTEIQVRRP